jgi:hypothetical protein
MNWKGSRRKRLWPGICLDRLNNTTKIALRIASVLAKIRKEHLFSTNVEGYRHNNLLRVCEEREKSPLSLIYGI